MIFQNNVTITLYILHAGYPPAPEKITSRQFPNRRMFHLANEIHGTKFLSVLNFEMPDFTLNF